MLCDIGKNIKKRLIDTDKSIKDLAEYAGVSDAYISMLCSGKREVGKLSIDKALRIADFLECSLYDLVSIPEVDILS